VLDFYWTDPIDAMKRSVAKLQYKDKLYTTFQPGTSYLFPARPLQQQFGLRRAMYCHRRHATSIGTPCADPNSSKSLSLLDVQTYQLGSFANTMLLH
jgi:hypothetical protein